MLFTFTEGAERSASIVGTETQRLGRLAAGSSLLIAPGFVIANAAEELFYRSNNLPEQLRQLFAHINPRRLDENALETACAAAQQRVQDSYLLEDFSFQLKLAIQNIGLTKLHLRRPDERPYESGEGLRGLLIALKKLWAKDWSFAPTLARLDQAGSIGLEARGVLVFADTPHPDPVLSKRVSQALQEPLYATSVEGMVAGLYLPASHEQTV